MTSFAPGPHVSRTRSTFTTTMTTNLLRRWLMEDDGQDLIEYGLLASFVGFTMFAAAVFLRGAMHDTYTSWDTVNQDDRLVEIPDPQ